MAEVERRQSINGAMARRYKGDKRHLFFKKAMHWGHARVEMVDVVEADIAGQPVQDVRQGEPG
jgi:hypothetical protein